MSKILKSLALAACTATLCVTMTGCEDVKGAATSEEPGRMVYVYLPDGTLLDKGRADEVSSFVYNDRIVKVTINGKAYKTSWANVVLVEE